MSCHIANVMIFFGFFAKKSIDLTFFTKKVRYFEKKT
jgi:hypothetical protein